MTVRNTAARLARLSRPFTTLAACDLMRTPHCRVHRTPERVMEKFVQLDGTARFDLRQAREGFARTTERREAAGLGLLEADAEAAAMLSVTLERKQ